MLEEASDTILIVYEKSLYMLQSLNNPSNEARFSISHVGLIKEGPLYLCV